MSITLYTSGTTKAPKVIEHSWEYITDCAVYTIQEMDLTSESSVLDVFPSNTIAHWTISAFPAYLANAEYSCMKFDAKTYVENFTRIQPTHINLVPAHLPLLEAEPTFKDMDMSCVKYTTLGADNVTQDMINILQNKGATVMVWYGMTENPPPVMIGYGRPVFTKFNPAYDLTWTADNELIINGEGTQDIFKRNIDSRFDGSLEYDHRIQSDSGNSTWKNTF